MKKRNILLLLSLLTFSLSLGFYFQTRNQNFSSPIQLSRIKEVLTKKKPTLSHVKNHQLNDEIKKFLALIEKEESSSAHSYDTTYYREAVLLFVDKMNRVLKDKLGEDASNELLTNYFALILARSQDAGDLYLKYEESQDEYYNKILPSNLSKEEKKEFKRKMLRDWKKQHQHSAKLRNDKYKYWGDLSELYDQVREEVNAEMIARQPNSNILHLEL